MWITTNTSINIYHINENDLEFRETLTNFPINPEETSRIIKYNKKIYFATLNGLLHASSDYLILKDPARWDYYSTTDILPSDHVTDLAVRNDTLYIATAEGGVWLTKEGQSGQVANWQGGINKIVCNNENIYFIRSNLYYKLEGSSWRFKGSTQGVISGGTIDQTNNLWLGIRDGGLKKETWSSPFKIDGPASNFIGVVIKDRNNNLWMTSGRYRTLSSRGFYRYDFTKWTNYMFAGSYWSRHNSTVSIREDGDGNIWIGSWGGGLMIITGDSYIFFHNTSSEGSLIISSTEEVQTISLPDISDDHKGCFSGLIVDDPQGTYIVIPSIIKDNENRMWLTNYQASSLNAIIAVPPMNSMNIQSCSDWYYFGSQLEFYQAEAETGPIEFDFYGRLWCGTYADGIRVIDFGESLNNQADDQVYTVNRSTSYLYANKIFSLKNDHDGYMWIGTDQGLYSSDGQNVYSHIGGVNEAGPVGSFINNIFVDVNNNKWFATDKGLSVLLGYKNMWNADSWKHFTPENSGLPSKMVNSVFVDDKSGTAYIGTEAGLSVFHSSYSEFKPDFQSVAAGPNPFILDGSATFTITNLMLNSTVKIFNLNADLVKVLIPDGSRVTWDGRNENNIRVPSGIYLYLAYTADGLSTTGKIAVIKP
jgi:ligand-binding sensor domain-containing protein